MSGSARRRILLVAHPKRQEAHDLAAGVLQRLHDAGMEVVVLPDEAAAVDLAGSPNVTLAPDPDNPAEGCELVCVLGGDGTILRGAELSRGSGAPLLGVNLGHVGFLAESEREDLGATVERIVARDYEVEERMTLDVIVKHDDEQVYSSWALNEASVEKAARERMLELTVEIDGRPLSTWGCDGVVMATPTARRRTRSRPAGPWCGPDVEAMLLVPISAHALFARPLVVGPNSHLALEVVPVTQVSACCGATGAGRSTSHPARGSRWSAPRRRCVWRGSRPLRSRTGSSRSSTSRSTAGAAPPAGTRPYHCRVAAADGARHAD